MKKLKIPIITEGKYDKIKLKNIVCATVITTDGFGVFRSEEKRALIRTLGRNGVVILCDSDGGGRIIRSHLRGMLGGIRTYDLYIPEIEGKERRKAERSKAGLLGVEGVPNSVLTEMFDSLEKSHPELFDDEIPSEINPQNDRKTISKSEMYSLGLTGGENSAQKRDEIAKKLSLPSGMNANSLCEAMTLLGVTAEDAEKLLAE